MDSLRPLQLSDFAVSSLLKVTGGTAVNHATPCDPHLTSPLSDGPGVAIDQLTRHCDVTWRIRRELTARTNCCSPHVYCYCLFHCCGLRLTTRCWPTRRSMQLEDKGSEMISLRDKFSLFNLFSPWKKNNIHAILSQEIITSTKKKCLCFGGLTSYIYKQ